MEIADVVGSEVARTEVSLSFQENSADPVVYQLVRVDGDGRLVPATDEEVMAVEDLIEDDKSEAKIITDIGRPSECSTIHACGSDKIQFIDAEVLQKPDADTNELIPNAPSDPGVGSGKLGVQLEEKAPPLDPSESDASHGQPGPEECSKLSGGFDKNGSADSTICTSSKPDFSLLKGELQLDDLSVKELQETFWATFGRETSVKDKLWLKRRIIMGLTNSCDFSTSTLVITDDGVVQKGQGEACKLAGGGVLFDCIVESASESLQKPSNSFDKHVIYTNGISTKTENSCMVDNSGSIDADREQRPAKRVRKPTRRYIEELSDGESKDSGAKIVSSVRYSVSDQVCSKVSAKPWPNFGLEGIFLTRKDSLGGSGVQVPYVSRIRRSRPRENFMPFMKLQPSGLETSSRLLENEAAAHEQLDGEIGNKILEGSSSTRWIQELPAASSMRCKPCPERKIIQMEREMELENMEPCKNDSGDEVLTVPTANGGMRRKHHRPWTLTEVVKLVEGVAKYGAGRWSEIKRVAFASYSYRTSVDLKDKWRNLLKASLAELPPGNGVHCSRKPGSVPIPASVLSRVRELAHIDSHIPLKLGSSKIPGCADSSSRSVREARSGFL